MMASALASSLKAHDGFDLDDVAQRYYDWRKVTFDCGSQTGGSLSKLSQNNSPEDCGRLYWEQGGKRSAGNGSLMRTAPIGVFFHKYFEDIVKVSLYDSAITHFDPRCMLACAAMNAAIGLCVRLAEEPLDPADIAAEAEKALVYGAELLTIQYPEYEGYIKNAGQDLVTDLMLATMDDPLLYGSKPQTPEAWRGTELDIHVQQGFVRVAFRLAFWELRHAPSFEAGLIDAVNRGADSDTNGAICGMLLGAFYGFDSIPPQWRDTVLNCDPGGALGKGSMFHPLRLMELADAA
jgi:ADP-ribosylglycohydrolase